MILSRRKRKRIKATEIIKTKHDLNRVKISMVQILAQMGVSRNVGHFPIRFGKAKEFRPNSDAFYTRKDIVIKRGLSAVNVLVQLAHEYGHEVTLTGDYGTKSNLLGETTAYNFQKTFITNFNNITKICLKQTWSTSFIERFRRNSLYTAAIYLSFIPLGRLIKQKYKAED